jgi:hypothetical protein
MVESGVQRSEVELVMDQPIIFGFPNLPVEH